MSNNEIMLSKVTGRKIVGLHPNAVSLASVYRLLADSYPHGNHGIAIPVSFTAQELQHKYTTAEENPSVETQQMISTCLRHACNRGYLKQEKGTYFFTEAAWKIFQEVSSTIQPIRR